MAIADYFFRDVVAISQVLQGVQKDELEAKLTRTKVVVAFGANAASSKDGRWLLDLTVRLLARLYPCLSFIAGPREGSLVDELAGLASEINPNISVAETDVPSACISVGIDAPHVEAPTIFAGCNGWRSRVGTSGPYEVTDTGNPVGSGLAACIAGANLFRLLFLPDGASLLDRDLSFPSKTSNLPNLGPTSLNDPLALVGVGAIGNGAVWALSLMPFSGQIYLVDPQLVDLGNIQRYVLCARGDENYAKVSVAGRRFLGRLEAIPCYETWTSFVENNGYDWSRVAVALDSAHGRRSVQASLPRWVANAWTQTGDIGVSTHSVLGKDACLSCLYLPTQKTKNQDQIVAEDLRIPHLQSNVRFLLGSGQPVGPDICNSVAAAWGLAPEALGPYWDQPINSLWVEGVCGGGFVSLGGVGADAPELGVPLAFQSVLAGVLLAAEIARDVVSPNAKQRTLVRQLDVLRPLGNTSRRPRSKAKTGNCICDDQDFLRVYQTKYQSEE